MLELKIPEKEYFDERTNKFFIVPSGILTLEHSLQSISRWEACYKKAFLTNRRKSKEEYYAYFQFMDTGSSTKSAFANISHTEELAIVNYMDDPMTAVYIPEPRAGGARDVVVSELIYYWMTEFNIPFECDTWHLNRLLALINVCSRKKSPKKNQNTSVREALASNAALNKKRREELGTSG
jgi:hypothetical protein